MSLPGYEYNYIQLSMPALQKLNDQFDLAVVIPVAVSGTKEDKSLSSLVILRKIN